MSVRYIHTQEQARAELELQAARKKVSDARRKERMQNDPEYRDKLLQSRKTKRQQKRKALEEDRQGNVIFLAREMVASPDQTRAGIRWFLSGVS